MQSASQQRGAVAGGAVKIHARRMLLPNRRRAACACLALHLHRSSMPASRVRVTWQKQVLGLWTELPTINFI